MKFTDYFDRISIINLPERTDRKRAVLEELKGIGCSDSSKVQVFRAFRPDNAGGFRTLGARGCFLSHQAVIKKAKEDGIKHLLIVEDDLAIVNNFKVFEESVVDALKQNDWDIFYPGHFIKAEELQFPHLTPYTKPILCTHFIAINGEIFDKLLVFLDQLLKRPPGHPDGGPMDIDGAYTTFRMNNKSIKTFVANPSLGKQRSSRSDVMPYRWFDRTPIVKNIVAYLRRFKG